MASLKYLTWPWLRRYPSRSPLLEVPVSAIAPWGPCLVHCFLRTLWRPLPLEVSPVMANAPWGPCHGLGAWGPFHDRSPNVPSSLMYSLFEFIVTAGEGWPTTSAEILKFSSNGHYYSLESQERSRVILHNAHNFCIVLHCKLKYYFMPNKTRWFCTT